MDVDGVVTASDAPADTTVENSGVRRGQWIGLGALVILSIALAIIMFRNSDNSVNDLETLSSEVHTMGNVVLVQHESLQFASSYERWLSGTTTRSNLEIRREELTEKLALLDTHRLFLDEHLSLEFLSYLRSLDGHLVGTPPSFLSPDEQVAKSASSDRDLNMFILLARQMAESESDESADPLTTLFQDEINRQNSRNAALLASLALIFLAAGFIGFTFFRDLKNTRNQIELERQKLNEANIALREIDDELQLRLNQEQIDRAENEWLNSTVRSISLEFKSSVVPDTIAKSLVENLGKALGVDVVLFYSFADHPMPRLWKQWHRVSEPDIDESVVTDHELDLLRLLEHLWKRKRKVIVNDSQMVNVSRDPIPELAAITQMGARSWMLVPVGAGPQVMGCVAVGMVKTPRVWSTSEIDLLEKVVAEVADVFTQARLFRQSMQIAENDAEVNRLVELDKIKNDLIENMNHELRTPLTSIIGYLEVIMADVDSKTEPELASALDAIQRNAVRLQSLMDNMMRPSRVNFHDVKLNVVQVNIGHLLSDLVDSLQLGIDESGVTLKVRMESPLRDLIIDGDVLQLEQVFVNLMSNAIKYTPRGGTITVSARRVNTTEKFVEVKVRDTGIGIPSEEFSNVFQRFFRASTATKASIPGFGIGLSLVHSIVQEHRGTITFDSTVGKGTVFTVTLPVKYQTSN